MAPRWQWRRSLLPVSPWCALVPSNHAEQIAVQGAVGGDDFSIVGTKLSAAHVRHRASGFRHDDGTGGDIPRRETPFPVSVKATGCDIAEIEGGGARLPYGLHASQEVTPDFGLVRPAREVIRKAGHEDGCDELVNGGNEDWRPVQVGAATFASDKQLI